MDAAWIARELSLRLHVILFEHCRRGCRFPDPFLDDFLEASFGENKRHARDFSNFERVISNVLAPTNPIIKIFAFLVGMKTVTRRNEENQHKFPQCLQASNTCKTVVLGCLQPTCSGEASLP